MATTTDQNTSAPGTAAYKPNGYTTLTPFLCVKDAEGAITFYTNVFGATLLSKMEGPDGLIAHAELQLEDGRLQLADPIEGYGLGAHDGSQPATHSIAIYVPDCDAVVAAAEEAGATVREQPSTFVTGDRFGSILDPFGVRWSVMTRVEEVSDEEGARRVTEWIAQQS